MNAMVGGMMKRCKEQGEGIRSVAGLSFYFAYILAFLFEGQVLYSLLKMHGANVGGHVLTSMVAHFAGLLTAGLIAASLLSPRQVIKGSMIVCLVATLPFCFPPTYLWSVSLVLGGYASGCGVASWGYYLRRHVPKGKRIGACADVLILSNVIMIALNVVAANVSAPLGLFLAMLCIVISLAFFRGQAGSGTSMPPSASLRVHESTLRKSLALLCLFIFVITINSGLMYQVINPAFQHLTGLVSWYWALPYIVALIIMRNLSVRFSKAKVLYLGMVMIVASFIAFMIVGRRASDYLVVDTLMLGACGIFDLFWWSILGEMLDYTDNPVFVWGVGLSANVGGVLLGGVLGTVLTTLRIGGAEVAVIALTVMFLTLILLPVLNKQLVSLLESHTYLMAYDSLNRQEQTDVLGHDAMYVGLTVREQEVLALLLQGKSNRDIAESLFITESTVKTHVGNILAKYGVKSRVELFSSMLKDFISL